MKNRIAWQIYVSHHRQTDRQTGGETAILPLSRFSDVTSDGLWLATDDRLQKQGGRKWKKRKEERERERERESEVPPPPPLELWEAAGLEKAEGRKGCGEAYCLSSVCCGSSFSAHSSSPGYLYPLNIRAGGGRLQSFLSLHILWRRCIKESAHWGSAGFHYFSYTISPFIIAQRWVPITGLYTVF